MLLPSYACNDQSACESWRETVYEIPTAVQIRSLLFAKSELLEDMIWHWPQLNAVDFGNFVRI